MRRLKAWLFSPAAQVLCALGGMIGGAFILGRVAVGWTVLFCCLLLLLDGMFRQPKVPNDPRELTGVEQVLDRFRNAR